MFDFVHATSSMDALVNRALLTWGRSILFEFNIFQFQPDITSQQITASHQPPCIHLLDGICKIFSAGIKVEKNRNKQLLVLCIVNTHVND